jgi:DNA repair exonuclease SbcCD ATPase subunit
MSEYVRKQALVQEINVKIDWLIGRSEYENKASEISKVISEFASLRGRIQSGAFDADQTEVQRLRAALCELEKENRKLRQELDLLQELAVKATVEREKERKSAQQEIERLREENERRKKIIEAYMRIEHDLAEDAERYLQQRDKLIEVLRWYAATENWRLSLTHMLNDGGQRARDILKEIGVTVE